MCPTTCSVWTPRAAFRCRLHSARCSRAMVSMVSTAIPRWIGPALDAGGNALLAEIEALIAGFPPYSEQREQFSLALYRHQRNAQDRRRGPCRADRRAQSACRDHGGGHLRRSRSQISRSGSPAAFARNSRRPPTRSARSRRNWAPGWRRQSRPEHGNDDGQRQQRCRWRTGPPHSRARPPRRRLARGARRRHLYRRHVRRRRLYARDPANAGRARDRHRSRPAARSRAAPTLSSQAQGRLELVEDRFSNLDT